MQSTLRISDGTVTKWERRYFRKRDSRKDGGQRRVPTVRSRLFSTGAGISIYTRARPGKGTTTKRGTILDKFFTFQRSCVAGYRLPEHFDGEGSCSCVGASPCLVSPGDKRRTTVEKPPTLLSQTSSGKTFNRLCLRQNTNTTARMQDSSLGANEHVYKAHQCLVYCPFVIDAEFESGKASLI